MIGPYDYKHMNKRQLKKHEKSRLTRIAINGLNYGKNIYGKAVIPGEKEKKRFKIQMDCVRKGRFYDV